MSPVERSRNGRTRRARAGSRRKRIADWPTYLLKNIPESDRRRLSGSAADQNISVSDVVRGLLCARYRLDCPRESYRYEPDRDRGARTILLRLQPRLNSALELEVSRTGSSKRRIILDVIEAHYKEGEPSA